ncbi:MAG: 2-oxo acid dehydrogenase subunit E2 [Kiritimatiellae bacterium]|nr:2-oxo acid dehydrogenase subunit E2 [Kiritimatiellia bacterium]
MAQPITMPKFGQTVEEATIVKWHKQEGDAVRKGDVLFEIETDKAVLETESYFDGTLLKIVVPAGQTVPVAATVGVIGEPGEDVPKELLAAPAVPKPAVPPGPPAVAPKAGSAVPAAAAPAARGAAPVPAAPAAEAAGRFKISPRARALANRCAIDPAAVRGTGPGGRVVERDVREYLKAKGYERLRISPAAKGLARREGVNLLSVAGTGDAGRIVLADVRRAVAEKPRAMSKMRQVIAERLTHSFTSTPHFYVTVSADMTELLAYRAQLKAEGLVYSVTDFILEAVVLSLQEYPAVNSVTDGRTVTWHGKVHLGVAVSVEDGLVVPVVFNADDLTMRELNETAGALARRAREGKLLPDEMKGSTFTVSNMGMMDVENFTAIINPGESAILAVSSTVPTPAVADGAVVVRSIMKMTLSADHRIVDGAVAAQFVNAVKTKLEDLGLWKSLT